MPIQGAGDTTILGALDIAPSKGGFFPFALFGEKKKLHMLSGTFSDKEVPLGYNEVIICVGKYIFHVND